MRGRLAWAACTALLQVSEAAARPAAVTSLLSRVAALHRSQPSASLLPAHRAAWEIIREAEESACHDAEQLESTEAEDEPPLSALYARAATDGELLDDGVVALLDALQLDERSVFADLGSGGGGAVLRVASASPVRRCYGIELVATKHAAATALRETVAQQLAAPVTLWQGDLIEMEQHAIDERCAAESAEAPEAQPDALFAQLTHAYSCSVCFDDFLLRRMAATLANRDLFPRFQALVSLRQLPSQPHLTPVGTVRLSCTWNAAVTGHVYVAADVLERAQDNQPVAILERFLCHNGTCTLPASLQWPQSHRLPP